MRKLSKQLLKENLKCNCATFGGVTYTTGCDTGWRCSCTYGLCVPPKGGAKTADGFEGYQGAEEEVLSEPVSNETNRLAKKNLSIRESRLNKKHLLNEAPPIPPCNPHGRQEFGLGTSCNVVGRGCLGLTCFSQLEYNNGWSCPCGSTKPPGIDQDEKIGFREPISDCPPGWKEINGECVRDINISDVPKRDRLRERVIKINKQTLNKIIKRVIKEDKQQLNEGFICPCGGSTGSGTGPGGGLGGLTYCNNNTGGCEKCCSGKNIAPGSYGDFEVGRTGAAPCEPKCVNDCDCGNCGDDGVGACNKTTGCCKGGGRMSHHSNKREMGEQGQDTQQLNEKHWCGDDDTGGWCTDTQSCQCTAGNCVCKDLFSRGGIPANKREMGEQGQGRQRAQCKAECTQQASLIRFASQSAKTKWMRKCIRKCMGRSSFGWGN
tara:strand:- start:1000 stop:2301 length:1302 start_codon:yes stop_codon:yes gene_type:complete